MAARGLKRGETADAVRRMPPRLAIAYAGAASDPSPARVLQQTLAVSFRPHFQDRRLSPRARIATAAGLALGSWALLGATTYLVHQAFVAL